tara:strand:+ start:10020 stop:10880 length:861 start_codon:yes stop_codon:yes gene_type:complete
VVVFDNLYYAVENSEALGFPFSNWQVKGKHHYWSIKAGYHTGTDAPEKRKAIKLDDRDIALGKSSALTFTIADGYKARIKVYTENDKYFSDNTKSTPSKNDVDIKTELLFDESIELVMFEGDYLSIDIDEEHSGIYRYRLHLGNKNYNINDPKKINDEVWVELIEARLIDGGENEPKFGDEDIIITPNNETIITGSNEDTDGDGIPDYLDYDPLDPTVQTIEDVEEEEEEEEEEKKESNGMSWKGVLIIGAVVVGIVLLLRFARNSRASDSSNSTKSPSDGGSSVE